MGEGERGARRGKRMERGREARGREERGIWRERRGTRKGEGEEVGGRGRQRERGSETERCGDRGGYGWPAVLLSLLALFLKEYPSFIQSKPLETAMARSLGEREVNLETFSSSPLFSLKPSLQKPIDEGKRKTPSFQG